MMGEREDVRLDRRRGQGGFAGRLHVARQQHPPPGHVDPHHERAIVAGAAGPRRRPERRHHEIAEREGGPAGRALLEPRAPDACCRHQIVERGIGETAGREPDAIGGNARQERRQAAPMVEVGVGRHHQPEVPHPEGRERRRHHDLAEIGTLRYRGAAVHQHRRLAPLHQEGRALPHVEGHQARRWRSDAGGWSQGRSEARRERAGDTPACRGGAERGQRRQRGEPENEAGGAWAEERRRRLRRRRADGVQREPRRRGRQGQEGGAKRPGREGREPRGGEAEREQQELGPGHEDQVRHQPDGGPATELRGDRCGRDEREGAGGEEAVGRAPQARQPAHHVCPRGPSRQEERGAGREGHLGAGVEEGLGLERQHGARREPERLRPARGAAAPSGGDEGQHEDERSPHGHAPARQERVQERGGERGPEREPARVGAGRESRAARCESTQDSVE